MKKDMILHTKGKRLVCNGRIRVRLGAHSSSLRGALIQGQSLSANEVTSRARRDYVSLATRLRLVVMLLMMVGVGSVWGQTDYSGIYYIRSFGQNQNDNNKYYLCPTEGWCFYKPTDDFSGDGTTYPNPFLTTYKCKTNDYHSGDSRTAIWTIEKAPNSNYYHIKQTSTGRYLLSNGKISNAGIDRIRVHLETVADPSTLGDEALFEISPYSGNSAYLTFRTVGINETGKHDNADHSLHKYLTVNGGNQNFLTGQSGKTGGPGNSTAQYQWTAGIVGIYTESDVNAPFSLEQATIDPPTITNNFDGTITITTEVGATIYYTTNGNTPTTSSYSGTGTTSVVYSLEDGVTVIKAIAKSSSDYFATYVRTYTIPQCERPNISVSGSTATITCSTPNASIYYALDDLPATPSTPYGGPFNTGGAEVIRAIATSPGYLQSTVAYYYPSVEVHSSAEITNMNGRYILADDFTSSASIGTADNPFKGFIDGNYNAFTLNGHALIGVAEDAVIKNIVVSNVTYSGSGNVGAIINTAKGSTKLYNSGVQDGSVSGGTNTGGLVGLIESGSSVRVVNCYSFASVSGGTTMAGIVGKNEGTIGNVRIALCMMYGEMAGTSPVYAGNHESNVQNFNEYNYWRYRSGLTYSVYNDQLAIDKDEYLTRFPFYRHILNTHRELAAYFLFAGNTTEGNVSDISQDNINEIGHWVLKKDVADYPIIEEWGRNTKKVLNAPARPTVNVRKGDGAAITSLSVTVKIGNNTYTTFPGTSTALALPITDMDEANYDYTWGKVVLPFANEFEVNNDYTKICTGWKITGITGGTPGTFSNYNMSDRDCTNKDLFENSGYIFAQGGNYIVPYGVTAITIEANFANAYYLSDPGYDIGLKADYTDATPKGGPVPSYHNQTVATNLKTLLTSMPEAANPHVQAIVLVGNYHFNDGNLDNTKKAFTLMSIDADNNQEPDYGFYAYNSTDRPNAPSMRFDFLPIIPVGMAAHVKGSTGFPGVPIWKVRGWFEMTETCVFYTSQCEIDSGNFNNNDDGNGNNRWIVNSGYFVQIVRSRATNCSKVSYVQMGGNVFVEEFFPGSHSDNDKTTTIVPVNVTGGEIKECYMTGYSSQANAKAQGDDIYFWCAGGKIHKFLGAYMETPTPKTTGAKVNMTAKVDHAVIGRFFGGGTSAKASIGGNITVTINNSKVDFYCGGPEFSSANESPVVETNANNTTFGEYYGAGFGGTSITYARVKQESSVNISSDKVYPISFGDVYKRLNKTDDGVGTCYKFEYIYHSFNRVAVARSYTGYAQFSLATTGNVTNGLTNCKIQKLTALETISKEATTGDFYGAGCQGKVNGTVSSTLTSCEVDGNVYGGGFKAAANEVKVYTSTAPSYSTYKQEMALFTDFGEFPEPQIFKWKPGDVGSNNDKKELYTGMTQEQMNELGNVAGNITLTIDGTEDKGSVIGTVDDSSTGNVFGGGNESKSLASTTVNLRGNTEVLGNVFGGGNEAAVEGSATVIIEE